MKKAKEIVSKKRWKVDKETRNRLLSLVDKFFAARIDASLELIDIEQFSSYFVTHVYKLVCLRNGEPVNYFAKFAYLPKGHIKRQRDRIKYEFDYTKIAFELFDKCDNFDSVEPLDYFPEEAAFVMAEMQGTRLDKLLISAMRTISNRDNSLLYKTMNDAGAWLKTFQDRMPSAANPSLNYSTFENRVNQYIEKIAILDPNLISKEFSCKLLNRTRSLLNDFDANDFLCVTKHNDFAPWNLMLGQSGIIGFDYADCEFDSKYYDLYHFTRALNTFKFKLIKKDNVIDECKQYFLNGYGFNPSTQHPTELYFNLFFSLERLHMLLRARLRNNGFVGTLKTLSQKRYFNWYVKELQKLAG